LPSHSLLKEQTHGPAVTRGSLTRECCIRGLVQSQSTRLGSTRLDARRRTEIKSRAGYRRQVGCGVALPKAACHSDAVRSRWRRRQASVSIVWTKPADLRRRERGRYQHMAVLAEQHRPDIAFGRQAGDLAASLGIEHLHAIAGCRGQPSSVGCGLYSADAIPGTQRRRFYEPMSLRKTAAFRLTASWCAATIRSAA
jgi:hypothetical protein